LKLLRQVFAHESGEESRTDIYFSLGFSEAPNNVGVARAIPAARSASLGESGESGGSGGWEGGMTADI